jgi:hypothetical protein
MIAEGIRDGVYRDAVEAERQSDERSKRRQRLMQHGQEFAARELRDVEGLSFMDIWKIENRVREELASVKGDETMADIEDWVDEILESEGIESDEDDD